MFILFTKVCFFFLEHYNGPGAVLGAELYRLVCAQGACSLAGKTDAIQVTATEMSITRREVQGEVAKAVTREG